MMTDCFAWGESRPGPAGWYAVVLMFGQLMRPAARRWDGERWNDARSIYAFHGPHSSEEDALDWAEESCPAE